jgi:hypothetical protein
MLDIAWAFREDIWRAAMKVERKLRKMTLTEHIGWAELLGLVERPDELRYDGGSWVVVDVGGADEPEEAAWEIVWPQATIVEVHPPAL